MFWVAILIFDLMNMLNKFITIVVVTSPTTHHTNANMSVVSFSGNKVAYAGVALLTFCQIPIQMKMAGTYIIFKRDSSLKVEKYDYIVFPTCFFWNLSF